MALRLYFDEDAMNSAVVDELARRGVNVVTAGTERRRGLSDGAQLAYATSVGRAVYSCNVADFARLHHQVLSEGRHHAGIILVYPQSLPVGVQVRGLLALSAAVGDGPMADRLEYLAGWA